MYRFVCILHKVRLSFAGIFLIMIMLCHWLACSMRMVGPGFLDAYKALGPLESMYTVVRTARAERLERTARAVILDSLLE